MLWLALYLPQFPLEVALRGWDEAAPAILEERLGNDCRVLMGNAAAAACGVRAGMKVSAARALVSGLKVIVRDLEQEAGALAAAACWAGQFTPEVSLWPQALLLRIDASLRLFGGLRRLWMQAAQGLAELGYSPRLACAPTPLAALYFARAGIEARVITLPRLQETLVRLPLDVMLQPEDILAQLRALAVHSLGDLRRLPRPGLARRFGPEVLIELDRAFGEAPHPQRCFVPPARFASKIELPAQVWEAEAVLFAARRLLSELAGFLAARSAAVQGFSLHLLHEDAPATAITVSFRSASRDPQHWLTVLREQLARTELPEAVYGLELRADDVHVHGGENGTLFGGGEQQREEADRLWEKLRARLGEAAVHGVALVAEHRPELAWRPAEPGDEVKAQPPAGPRPVWLLAEPVPLAYGEDGPRLDGPLELEAGPERIESGWWDEAGVARDYYIATEGGCRYWVYRDRRDGGWYWQGIFG